MVTRLATLRPFLTCGVAGWLVFLALTATGCRSKTPQKAVGKPAPSTTPALPAASSLPDPEQTVMVTFIKGESCAPSTCNAFHCEVFSSGQTQGVPSHIARCRWQDTRAPNPASVNRCAYVHYSEDPARGGFNNMFLSKPADEGCAPDPEFTKLIQTDVGYAGQLP